MRRVLSPERRVLLLYYPGVRRRGDSYLTPQGIVSCSSSGVIYIWDDEDDTVTGAMVEDIVHVA
jgi:hypothetical protein